jgi:hypothetical protein
VVVVGCLVLAVIPLLSAGAEKEIRVVTSADMVDRLAPNTLTYVSLTGLAMPLRFPGPGGLTSPPYGVIVRDAPGATDLTIVSSDVDPSRLRARAVVGRVTSRPFGDAAVAAFEARGEATDGLDPALVVIEITPEDDQTITDVAAAADLAGLADGTPVRIPVVFDPESLPTCRLGDEGCEPRSLAAGEGVFVHLTRDQAGVPLLVQTTWPSSVAPGTWEGPQVFNQPELEDFVELPPVWTLAGWGRILTLASIDHDPQLVRDRHWLGPFLLLVLAGLLLLGSRLGYPHFRPDVEGSRRWGSSPATAAPVAPVTRDLPVQVSGHAVTVEGRRSHLDETRAILRPGAVAGEDGRVTAALVLPGGELVALAAHDTGLLGQVERGEVVTLTGVQPALWAHWFGTNLRLTFANAEDRDDAARVAAGGAGSVGSRP